MKSMVELRNILLDRAEVYLKLHQSRKSLTYAIDTNQISENTIVASEPSPLNFLFSKYLYVLLFFARKTHLFLLGFL